MCSDSETCDLHSVQTYIPRQKLRLLANIVARHYGSYQRANKYLYTVVDRPFDMFDLHASFFLSLRTNPLFIRTPLFLRIFGNLCPLINSYS